MTKELYSVDYFQGISPLLAETRPRFYSPEILSFDEEKSVGYVWNFGDRNQRAAGENSKRKDWKKHGKRTSGWRFNMFLGFSRLLSN